MSNCIIRGCEKLAASHNLCGIHYVVWWSKDGPIVSKKKRKAIPSNRPLLSKMPEYKVWHGMKNRCNNSSDIAYGRYGARGIKVCDEWLGRSGFANFIRDMGERPSAKHSLDRIDNDGDYTASNCRWATVHQQAANKRNRSPHTGVRLIKFKQTERWLATLVVNKERVLRQHFETFNEAVQARQAAAKRYDIEL